MTTSICFIILIQKYTGSSQNWFHIFTHFVLQVRNVDQRVKRGVIYKKNYIVSIS